MAALNQFQITISGGMISSPVLTDTEMMLLGGIMDAAQKDRWSKGFDANGNPARPLAKVTSKGKVTYRHTAALRDNYMTGLLRSEFAPHLMGPGEVELRPDSPEAIMHARKAQTFCPMIGIAPSDIKALEATLQAIFAGKIFFQPKTSVFRSAASGIGHFFGNMAETAADLVDLLL